jgi:hypothetical protein
MDGHTLRAIAENGFNAWAEHFDPDVAFAHALDWATMPDAERAAWIAATRAIVRAAAEADRGVGA